MRTISALALCCGIAFASFDLAWASLISAGDTGFGTSAASGEVESIFLFIDSLGPDNAIVIGVDFDMTTAGENMPMVVAVLRHAFARNIPVFLTAFVPDGQLLIEQGFDQVTDSTQDHYYQAVAWDDIRDLLERDIGSRTELVEAWETAGNTLPENAIGWVFEGWDYVLLGYAPMFHIVILGMNDSIEAQFPSDMNGNDVSGMPALKEHMSLRDVDLAITISGSSNCIYWVTYSGEEIGLPVAVGIIELIAGDYEQYYQSGQIIGLMSGLQGTLEYESMLTERGLFPYEQNR